MPSSVSYGLKFNQAAVRSGGAHTNATTQQPATGGGGGGGGVTSVGAGTNVTVTGTSTSPVVNVATFPYADLTGTPTIPSVPDSAVLISSTSGVLTANANDYNVEAYGASIGGSASTNTTAINNAILAMNTAGGGRLTFPGYGTYSVNGALTAITEPCEICGMGWGVTTLSQTISNNGFSIQTTNPCWIHDINIQGPGVSDDTTGILFGSGTVTNSSSNVERVQITAFLTGIACVSTSNGWMVQNSTFGCTHSIAVGGTPTSSTAFTLGQSSAAMICNCTCSGTKNGIWLLYPNGVLIDGCQIVPPTNGIYITFPAATGQSDLWLVGNHIESTNGLIMDFTNTTATGQSFAQTTIVGNEFGNSGLGMEVINTSTFTSGSYWALKQVTITGNTVFNCPSGGILLKSIYNGCVSGNCVNCNSSGQNISLDASCQQVVVEGNETAQGSGISDASVGHTVSTLPAASGAKGQRNWVTDSTQTVAAGIGTTVVGSGGNFNPVYSDGSNWKIG